MSSSNWDEFVRDAVEEDGGELLARFRCPECDRALKVPEAVIGRRLVCPFCQTTYESRFEGEQQSAEALELAIADQPDLLTRWIPSQAISRVRRATQVLRESQPVAQARATLAQTAQAAMRLVSPLAAIAAGAASAAMPGAGEVLAGRTRTGFCTMAAYFGATAAAGAAGGAWIALPIAIRVLSSNRAISLASASADDWERALDANRETAHEVAEKWQREALSIDREEFERRMLANEADAVERSRATHKRVVLVRVEPRHASRSPLANSQDDQ